MGAALLASALLLGNAPLLAHARVPTRSLRLQLQPGALEGLLVYQLPPGPDARLFSAAAGLSADALARSDGPAALGLRLSPAALRGLRLAVGKPGALPVATAPSLLEASAHATKDGGLEAALLVRAARAAAEGDELRIEVEKGLPLEVQLLAPNGTRLTLREGLGLPIAGGLSLRPRPGSPCVVLIAGG